MSECNWILTVNYDHDWDFHSLKTSCGIKSSIHIYNAEKYIYCPYCGEKITEIREINNYTFPKILRIIKK